MKRFGNLQNDVMNCHLLFDDDFVTKQIIKQHSNLLIVAFQPILEILEGNELSEAAFELTLNHVNLKKSQQNSSVV
jgi:hypothetical protein